jgi:capsid protein
VEARADEYSLKDDVVYCQGSIGHTPRLTHGESIARELHDALLARQSEVSQEPEGRWMVDFV